MAPTLAVYSDEKYAENLASTKKRIGNSNQMQSNKTPLRSLRKARRDDATSLSTVEKMDQPFKSLHRRLHDDGKDHKQDTTTRDKENYANAASSHGRHKWPQASTTTSKASSIYTPNLAVAAPQTPYLLLSLEMNRSTSDGADDSLLFSPAPPHVFQTKKRLSLQPTRLKSPPERIPAVSNVSSDRHIVLAASPADSADAFQRQEQESKLHHEEISTHATKAAFSNANHQTDPGACGLTMGVSRAPLTVRTNETKRSKPFKQNSKSNEVEVATFAQTSKPAEQTKFEADALTKVQLETVNTTTKRSIRPTACQSTAEPITVEIEASTSLHQAQVNDLETTVNRLKLPLIAAHRGSMTALGRNVASLTHSRQLPVETPLMHSPDVAALTESVACVKHWSTAKLPCSVLHPTRPATPLTTRGNGVCMDLSGVFFDAAQKTATKPPRNSSASMKGNTKIAVAEKQIVLENKQIGNEQADKQVQALTKWLNYLFYPSESIGEENTVEEENSRLALRSLVLHQRMAKGRLAAAGLYRSSDMVSVRKVVSAEIIRNRIALRTDRDLYANLDHRNKITSLLLSYSAPWLQLGLETVFNTVIHPNRPTQLSPQARHRGAVPVSVKKVPLSRLKLMLKNFIVNSVLSDDKVLAKYTGGKCKVPSGSFGERYRAELRTIVLQRLLVLFFFLDRAKIANVLEKAPTLFTRTSVVKSTRDVLLAFCRDFLKAEGDFVKHLSRVGLHVFFKQEAVNELDFTVTNLRVDLNDGVRLAHMTDLLTGASLLQKLRLPAVSRLQKFHNVGLSLDRLAESGVALNFVAPHHIVDGHREMVLKLLWSVIAHCCLRELLTVHQVQAEIARIQTLHGIPHQQSLRGNKDNLKEVLMQWCDVVCSRFGLAVEDLTNSFADGKAVCYLIHYYHPTLLRVDEIYPTSRDALVKNISSDTLLSNERANGILANSCMSELGGIPEMVPTCDTISPPEEKSMILCLTFLCSRLVESSIEIRASVMIQNCYRGHRTRILRQMKKTAAFRIWSAWRMNKINYYETQKRRFGASVRSIERFLAANRASLQLVRLHRLKWEKSNRAAFLVQKLMRSFCLKKRMTCLIERNRSAVVLQCIWRRHFAHRRYSTLLLRHQASITIQYFWRLAQLRDSKTNAAAMQIQKLFRGYWSRFQFVIYVLDIIAVQSCSRRWLAKRYCEKLYGSTITLQRAIRCFFARRSLVQKRLSAFRSTSAIRVQTIVRQCLAKNVLVFTRRYAAATILMQSLWRKRQAQLLLTEMNIFKEERNSSVLIQSRWRCWKAKLFLDTLKVTKNERLASTMIQSQWRKVHAQHLLDCVKKDLICRVAAVFIQGAFRRQQARLCLAKLKLHAVRVNASVVVQSFWRGFYARLLSKSMHFAATHIQATARCLVQTRHFTALRKNAVLIQARWKTTIVVREFQACVDGIRLIQSIVRRYLANKRCCRRQDALLRLQCSGRNFLARSQYWELMRTKAFRDNASITLQRYWRGYCAFVKFHLVTQDILLIQSAYRRFLAVKISETRRWAVECLQQAVRRALACNCLRILQAQKKSEDLAEFDAANRIQAVFRGWLVRNVCAHLSHCALKVQRVFRGHVARIDCFLETLDIILVQSTVRRWLSRRSACRRCAAVLRLQYATRCFLARSELGLLIAAHQRANLEWYSAAIVQCACRKLSARRLALKESSALTIQKLWRCYTVHINYMLSILAAIEIQKAIRRYIAVSTYEFQFFAITSIQSFARLALYKIRAECEESSAVRMQSAVRMHSSRTAFLLRITEHRSVIRLQSITRKLTARSRFLLKKIAATVIQRFIRGFVARLQLETECFAASEIQRTWRGFLASEYLAWNILAAIKTQSFFRMLLAQRRADHYMLERLVTQRLRSRSVIKIQRAYLGYVYQTMIFTSACILQKAARHFLSRIAFGKVRLGVVRAQSLARGRTVRHKLSPEILARAICIERVNANARAAPRLKLSNRTTAALDTLLKSENLSELMDAVCILEVATRLSEVCCILFVKASAPSVLFSLIRTCNRSLPHVKLLHGVLLTMSNVAEYDHLLQSIATHEGAEVLLDLVQMFRDKNFVFFLVVSLLERVVRSKNDEVLALCTSKESLKRLKAVRDLCVRKLSVAGPDLVSQRNGSSRPSLHLSSGVQRLGNHKNLNVSMRQNEIADVTQGVRKLQRIIRLVECNRH